MISTHKRSMKRHAAGHPPRDEGLEGMREISRRNDWRGEPQVCHLLAPRASGTCRDLPQKHHPNSLVNLHRCPKASAVALVSIAWSRRAGGDRSDLWLGSLICPSVQLSSLPCTSRLSDNRINDPFFSLLRLTLTNVYRHPPLPV